MHHTLRLLSLFSLSCALACGDDASPPDAGRPDSGVADTGVPVDSGIPDTGTPDAGAPDALEIVGVYANDFRGEDVITETAFNGASIEFYDNEANVLVTQNPPDAEFNPDLFNRIVWTEPADGRFYYCFVDFALESLQAALDSTNTADDTDPANGGCATFPWTGVREAISLRGSYMSNFGGTETITSTAWTQSGPGMYLADWNEEERWVVTENAEDAEFNPSLFNRIVYTTPDATGGFFYCFVEFGLATADEARNSTATADDSDPENAGCADFPWTRLDPL